jgi:hypothetical protein
MTRSPLSIRLLIADLVGAEVTRAGIATLREDLAHVLAPLDEGAEVADALPHRRPYLVLVNRFLRRLMDLHAELVDEVERELRRRPATTPGGRRSAFCGATCPRHDPSRAPERAAAAARLDCKP